MKMPRNMTQVFKGIRIKQSTNTQKKLLSLVTAKFLLRIFFILCAFL